MSCASEVLSRVRRIDRPEGRSAASRMRPGLNRRAHTADDQVDRGNRAQDDAYRGGDTAGVPEPPVHGPADETPEGDPGHEVADRGPTHVGSVSTTAASLRALITGHD